ncbi:MAG: iron export ABC transporter permease subunit FetB [Actinomycetota bacterium]|jgi:putative ABC transport system permease protein|nr:iron export ABC transporter permease subunit FetB [Actinomycetota bacterium]
MIASSVTTGYVGWLGLVASLALVAVAVAISMWQHLDLERSLVWASVRAIVQLLAVGAVLAFVLDPHVPLAVSWTWVVLMVGFAAETIRRRAPEVPSARPLALLALGVASAVSLALLFGLRIFPMNARTVVPLAGMVVGNSMTATVVAARRVVGELADKRAEVEARLALGQPSHEAARPYVRSALRTAMISQIESTKAVGLVFLPGAMTGLILAGEKPVQAVLVQAAVMFLILGAVATTATAMALGLARRLFTADHRLVALARPV